ncbi:MAG TPA: hypothetical protein PKV82_14770, partial [Anaerolineae bacterium]|nr:hypothetical protein [Anaerolineae bacterium]
MVIQQTLVHRAEFFGIQGGVVDAARRGIVEGEAPEGRQQVAVGDENLVQRLMGEEFAVERRDAE